MSINDRTIRDTIELEEAIRDELRHEARTGRGSGSSVQTAMEATEERIQALYRMLGEDQAG